jgi:hypothetical protein
MRGSRVKLSPDSPADEGMKNTSNYIKLYES